MTASPTAVPAPSGTAAGPSTSAGPSTAGVWAVGRYLVTSSDALRVHDPVTGRVVRVLQQTPAGAVDFDVELLP